MATTTAAAHNTPETQEARAAPWHAIEAEAALSALGCPRDGLSSSEVERRRVQYGLNVLPRGKREGPLVLLWRQINNPLIWVLIASGLVAMLVDWEGEGIKNGVVILAVVVINSVIGFIQEYRAGKAIEALSRMVPEMVAVLRDGRKETVSAAELVPGDLVHLTAGDHVPADLRLTAGKSLQIDEAVLTGESVPVSKSTGPVPEDAPLGDRTCLAFAGTLVTYGTGTGVVAATGQRTELGKISDLLREATDLETPLTQALAVIGNYITVGILGVTAVMLAVGVLRTTLETGVGVIEAIRETLIFAIALAVGAIPEGLPAIVTISLAIGVQRMAQRQAVIRKLPAVETLGSTTVICSDKTGTLTRNEMTVRALWTPKGDFQMSTPQAGPGPGRAEKDLLLERPFRPPGCAFQISGVGYEPRGSLSRNGADVAATEEVEELVRGAALCSDATLREENGRWVITGDPTEGALVVAAEKLGLEVEALRSEYPRLDAIPFESDRQLMATLHSAPDETRFILVKGAPEVVARLCRDLDVDTLHSEVERLAAEGMRVLAVAVLSVSSEKTELQTQDIESGLRMLGLLGMIDPPRQEAVQAIEVCRAAGITVKMITGDHRATAASIGGQLGILSESGALAGAELESMDDLELTEAAGRVNVFARVAPEHKLRLVRALQERDEIVAMTGDGVNDAPALKQANIGVAMGITGSAASKQAADIVLTDDNFASIGAAVEEGRRVYDNLIKSLAFVLPTNLGLALILLCAVAFFPFDRETGELLLALSPIQLLWINLVATVSLALPLAFEAQEPDIMRRPPRRSNEPVFSRFLIKRTAVVALLMTAATVGGFLWEYYAELAKGVEPALALAESQTIAVTTIIILQCFYLANCRSLRSGFFSVGAFTNKWFYAGVALVLILQSAFIYLPPANTLFGSAPLNLDAWLKAIAIGAVILPAMALEKRAS